MSEDFERFYQDLKETEKEDAVLTSQQQIDRLLRPGSTYLNLNPFEVLQIDIDTDEDAARKKFKRLSLLVHPDKNADDRERAEKAFDILKKAMEQIETADEVAKCKECYSEARARLSLAMAEKRRRYKREGKGGEEGKIEEDEPACYRRALWIAVTKVFADREKRRRLIEERAADEKRHMMEELEKRKEKKALAEEFTKNFEESRDDRRGSWRKFTEKAAKRSAKGTGFRPPKVTKMA